jgi:putative PIN family toxin of toxin-antitoxin system
MVRGLARRNSPSGQILRLCDTRKVSFLLSKNVLAEYRRVLTSEEILDFHQITPDAVELVLRRLRYVSDYLAQMQARFRFDRDPHDAKFIELAIAGNASHIITHDLDLLSLSSGHSDAAKRFRQRLPGVRIIRAAEFLQFWNASKN